MGTRNYKKTPIREAVYKALIRDYVRYKDEIDAQLIRHEYQAIDMPNTFVGDYFKAEQLASFLFSKRVLGKYHYERDLGRTTKGDEAKVKRYCTCPGKVFRHKQTGKCNNKVEPLCYTQMLYKLYGDLKPFLKEGYSIALIQFRELITADRIALHAGNTFSDRLINSLLSRLKKIDYVQYARIPHFGHDYESKLDTANATLIVIYKDTEFNRRTIEQEISYLPSPFDTPTRVYIDASVGSLLKLITEYLSYPLIMLVEGRGIGLWEYLKTNNWHRYKVMVANHREVTVKPKKVRK